MTDELPDALIDHTAPPGTPMGVHATAASAPVYCWHWVDNKPEAVRWERRPDNWHADDELFEHHPGHRVPVRDIGVLSRVCGPVTAHDDPRCAPDPEIRAWAAAQPEEEPEAAMPDPT